MPSFFRRGIAPRGAVIASVVAASLALVSNAGAGADAQTAYGIGTPLTQQDIAAWNIDVAPDGRGLPAGSGDVLTGAHIFAAQCAACHGAQGQGLIGDALVGGQGTLATAKPKRTIGSYWPYATTLFDYIRRAMPYNAPESLSADEVYAVCAYLLSQNGVVPPDTRLDAVSLPQVKMPNRDGFVPDPRPGKF
jgi:mono/diheme cytochrome c family protein